MTQVFLDVRERDEFEAEHIPHSINVPLSHFTFAAPGVLNQLTERNVAILCRSGARAKLALAEIQNLGYSDKITAQVYAGGILEWKKSGNSTISTRRRHLPIMRQVQLVAGLAVLSSTALGVFFNPGFFGVSALIGAGLTFAGATGFYGMAVLLSKMPWNRDRSSSQEEL